MFGFGFAARLDDLGKYHGTLPGRSKAGTMSRPRSSSAPPAPIPHSAFIIHHFEAPAARPAPGSTRPKTAAPPGPAGAPAERPGGFRERDRIVPVPWALAQGSGRLYTCNMTMEFDVVVERDSEGYYVASVPALYGCHTQARSLDELMERVQEVIALCLEEEGTPPETLDFVAVQRVRVAS